MNLMKKRKVGLMMGAGLLLTGAGVVVAMTTTSCNKGDEKKASWSFSELTLTKPESADAELTLSAKVTNLPTSPIK
jgi:hypothetical protein